MKLLCLSNGHGEDAIALRILRALRHRADLEGRVADIVALPLVGEGHAYSQSGIPVIGPVKRLPSGGFVYMDGRQFAKDLRGGLLQLTLSQLRVVRKWAKQGDLILAVGDLVPLLFAWWSGAPYAFVGTAKSEYYLRDEVGLLPRASWFERLESWSGSVYLPWERWLMGRPRCRAVFPRDSLTSEVLSRWKLPVHDLGNPMMDDLEPMGIDFAIPDEALVVTLLPGSRVPEAYRNWETLLDGAQSLVTTLDRPVTFLAAIAPYLDLAILHQALQSRGWHLTTPAPVPPLAYRQDQATLLLTTAFNGCVNRADLAMAMAGTATEQVVGLGKPALIFAGEGPQFTPAFAEAQTRLLGPSVIWVEPPSRAAEIVQSLLKDPDRLQLIAENGRRRMGLPGASDRIAACLLDCLRARG